MSRKCGFATRNARWEVFRDELRIKLLALRMQDCPRADCIDGAVREFIDAVTATCRRVLRPRRVFNTRTSLVEPGLLGSLVQPGPGAGKGKHSPGAQSLEQRAEVAAPAKSAPVTAPSHPRSSYASMLRRKIAKVATPAPAGSARRQTIAVCPADPQKLKTSEATRAELQASVNPAGLNVKALRRGPKAGLILEMEGEDSIARLKAKLPSSLKVEEPRKRLPRVIIFDAPADTKVEQVRESLQHLAGESDGMGDAIQQTRVCFDTKPNRAVKNLVVEVHLKIRHVLLRVERVFISWNSCRVRDYLVSTRCFKCQRYGHVAKHCREKSDTCDHCPASGHSFKDCPRKQEAPVCANCKRRGRDHKHDVRSEACPERARASDALIRTTDYAP